MRDSTESFLPSRVYARLYSDSCHLQVLLHLDRLTHIFPHGFPPLLARQKSLSLLRDSFLVRRESVGSLIPLGLGFIPLGLLHLAHLIECILIPSIQQHKSHVSFLRVSIFDVCRTGGKRVCVGVR